MNVARIEELIELMRRSQVVELSLEVADCKLRIRRGGEMPAAPAPALSAAADPAGPVRLPEPPPARSGPTPVSSPVVGVFHSRGAEAHAVGTRIGVGELLATVEAMKVPHEVRSPLEGTLSAVLVEEGQPVEFGQALFTILPHGGGDIDESEAAVG